MNQEGMITECITSTSVSLQFMYIGIQTSEVVLNILILINIQYIVTHGWFGSNPVRYVVFMFAEGNV